jgi:hypothetical protein
MTDEKASTLPPETEAEIAEIEAAHARGQIDDQERLKRELELSGFPQPPADAETIAMLDTVQAQARQAVASGELHHEAVHEDE